MATENTTETTTENTTENTGDDQEARETADDAAARKARSGARRLRERLHSAETERDRLAGLVAGYRRRDAETAAEQAGLASGGDLWAGGVDVDDLLDETGRVDPDRVTEAVKAITTERPHWRRRPAGSADQGARGTAPSTPTWHDLLAR